MALLPGTAAAAPPMLSKAPRITWLDLFRGLAVVLMIEAHVVNTFLEPALKANALFAWMNFFNGLVAPAFLFIAGYLQGLGLVRNRGKAPAVKWMRLAGLAAISYLMHAPFYLWGMDRTQEALRLGSQVDVLQCLALSLALVLAIQRFAGKFDNAILLAALAATLGSAVSLQAFRDAPVPLLAYINGSTGSLFPLFPWMGFVLAGVLAGRNFGTGICQGRDRFFMAARELALLPGLVLALGYALPMRVPFVPADPVFFLQRLGWVLAAAWICKWLAHRCQPAWLMVAGRESLTMYVAHLVIISQIAGTAAPLCDAPKTALLYLGVLAGTWLLSWSRMRLSSRRRATSARGVGFSLR